MNSVQERENVCHEPLVSLLLNVCVGEGQSVSVDVCMHVSDKLWKGPVHRCFSVFAIHV